MSDRIKIKQDDCSHSYLRLPAFTRRKAIRYCTGVLLGAVAYCCTTSGDWLTQQAYTERSDRLLSTPVTNLFGMLNCFDIIGSLCDTYGVPVSLIERPGISDVRVAVKTGTVKDVLNQIIAHNPHYRWYAVKGRLIVLPITSVYDRIVRDVNLVNIPRWSAANLYFYDYVRRLTPRFSYGVNMIRIGAWSPHDDDPVTLTQTATLLDHLVQLLGSDQSLAFYLFESKMKTHCFQIFRAAKHDDVPSGFATQIRQLVTKRFSNKIP